jgi:AraC family L-rhamnose operon regulatory protein RhaS
MLEELLKQLSVITPEEQRILNGEKNINRSLYYRPGSVRKKDEIDSSLVLANGKLIDMRTHTRFVHFPEHTHNYVEFVYMCKGSTRHIIDGNPITLKEGDLLFMNQHARQEILAAGKDDLAVNIMILPQFFDRVLRQMDETESSLRDFVISCLTEKDMGGDYLYFDAEGIVPVQNLMENLIWIMLKDPHDRRTLLQTTMSLLFMNLLHYADRIHVAADSYEQNMSIRLLRYVETEFRTASLAAFADKQHLDIYTLSRLIKRQTGETFKEILMRRRMNQAAYLLKNTNLSVTDIAHHVGYENTSYFHRLFLETFGLRPKAYRLQEKTQI